MELILKKKLLLSVLTLDVVLSAVYVAGWVWLLWIEPWNAPLKVMVWASAGAIGTKFLAWLLK